MTIKVPVHNSISMHTTHSRYQVVHDIAGLLLRKVVLLKNYVEKLHSLTVLCHNVDKLPLLKDFVNLQDARMILYNAVSTRPFRRDTSFIIMFFDFANLNVLIFLIALTWLVASCSAKKT